MGDSRFPNLLMGMKIKKIGLVEGTSLGYLKSATRVEKAEILSSSFHVSGPSYVYNYHTLIIL